MWREETTLVIRARLCLIPSECGLEYLKAWALLTLYRGCRTTQSFDEASLPLSRTTTALRCETIKVMLGPSLHTLRNTAHLNNFSSGYTEILLKRATTLFQNKVPIIFSLAHLAKLAGVKHSYLIQIVDRSEISEYRIFNIKKKSGGFRRICVPAPELEAVQRWIHTNILKSPGALKAVHDAARAYLPESSAFKNAHDHAGCKWLIKIDIKDFFESVSERQVYYAFQKLGYSSLLSFQLARICSRVVPGRDDLKKRLREKKWRWTAVSRTQQKIATLPYKYGQSIGHLPQGAPTSPLVSNLVFTKLDNAISAFANEVNGVYTRYADDIVISFSDSSRESCEIVFRKVSELITRAGYRINKKKSGIRSSHKRLIVTGLIINSATPKLKKEERLKIEAALYHIKKRGLLAHAEHIGAKNPLNYINHLHGKIVFARSVEPDFGQKCLIKLNEALAQNADTLELLRALNFSSDMESNKFRKCV